MRSERPLLSVGLPVYNGQNFLEQALESILAQTLNDFELVICDNASTDATESVCRRVATLDPRVRYFRNKSNLGAARNFNRAFRDARGKYFAWAAHDDLFAPDYYERCVAHLEANPRTVLCCARTQFIDQDGRRIDKLVTPLDIFEGDLSQRFLHLVGSNPIMVEIFGVYRSDVLAKTQLIENFAGSDIVLFGEVMLHGDVHCLPETLFFHREHMSRSMRANTTPEARLAWFDPAKRKAKSYPLWRRLGEHALSVWRAPLDLTLKFHLWRNIVKASYWSRGRLIDELWANLSLGKRS